MAEQILRLQIITGNAAFTDNETTELSRILRSAADKVESGQDYGDLMDYNGNRVGTFEIINLGE